MAKRVRTGRLSAEKSEMPGFINPQLATLKAGAPQSKQWLHEIKVGTGWSRTVSGQIRKQLDTVVSPKSKLTKAIRKPKATWVDLVFTAEAEYRDITSEGLL